MAKADDELLGYGSCATLDEQRWIFECTDFLNDYSRILLPRPDVSERDFYILEIAIKPEYQHQGIGTEITKAQIEMATKEKAPMMYVNSWMKGNSHKMYQKLGFMKLVGARNFYANGDSTLFMGLRTNQGQSLKDTLRNLFVGLDR